MKKIIVTVLPVVAFMSCGSYEIGGHNSTNNTGSFHSRASSQTITVGTIETRDAALFRKTVVLSDTGEYSITTYFKKFIYSYPFGRYGFDQYWQRAIQDTLTHDTLRMENYMKYKFDGPRALAYHLENGSVFIYDKKLKDVVKAIDVETYVGDPISGRRFYIRGDLVLDIADRIN